MKTILFLTLMVIFLFSSSAFASTIGLIWDPNTESDLAGYRIFWGKTPRTGTDPVICGLCGYEAVADVGNFTTYTITGLILRQLYYISATAYDTSGNESAFSIEVSGPAKLKIPNFRIESEGQELTIYREGIWYVLPPDEDPYAIGWGLPNDIPVPGDYDGDGLKDVAVFRDGIWFILPSSGIPAYAVGWGQPGDVPKPGDYDGDGKTDLAVYRPETGVWFIVPSGGGAPYGIGWGGSPSDIPL